MTNYGKDIRADARQMSGAAQSTASKTAVVQLIPRLSGQVTANPVKSK